jgi:hypothetical protein
MAERPTDDGRARGAWMIVRARPTPGLAWGVMG